MRKIRLGLTMGDPGGIGPEIILKTLCEPEVTRKADICVIGPALALDRISKIIGISPIFQDCSAPEQWTWRKAPFVYPVQCQKFETGRPAAENGRVSILSLETAVNLVKAGYIDGIVTAPISKEAWFLSGCDIPGHTDFLASRTNQETVLMMMTGKLRVSLVSCHVPLKTAVESLRTDKIVSVIRMTHSTLISRMGFSEPSIGVAALNPHAGEGGILGREDAEIVRPAVELAGREGIHAFGPIPADTVFRDALIGKYDAVVALYHDQGLIPVKVHDFFGAVNVTLGLPFIRTSPGHGTAFDIALKGVAQHRAMMEAVLTAVDMARRILLP